MISSLVHQVTWPLSQGAPLPAHRLEAPAKLGPRQLGLAFAVAPADDSDDGCTVVYSCTVHDAVVHVQARMFDVSL